MPRCEMCGEWPDCPWKTDPEIMCGEFHPKPITNADRIRSMTDEELAEWASAITLSEFGDKKDWLDWLKQEVTANDS